MTSANDDRPDSDLCGPGTSFPHARGFLDEEEDHEEEEDGILSGAAMACASLLPETPSWKAALRRDFERWLDSLEEIPEASAEEQEAAQDAPSLFSFHEQLTAATTEWKRSGRRTADALAQLGDSLAALGEETRQLRAQRTLPDQGNHLPDDWCLSLVEISDRLRRLQQAFDRPPPAVRTWWSGPRKALEAWGSTWQTQAEAFAILTTHVDTLLRKAGLEPISTKGQLLDPSCMTAVAVETQPSLPDQTVLEEALPGYRRGGKVLRAAHVKVSRPS